MSIELLNWIGLAIFAFCTVVYHGTYHWVSRRHPLSTVKGKVERYRKDWVEGILQSRNLILAVQTVRNNIMATTWLAGTAILILAFLLTSGIKGAESEVFQNLGIVDHGFLTIKVDLLLITYGFAFLAFLFSLRHLILFNTLIGTSPELITQIEGVEASEFLSKLVNRAHSRFTFGLRATYFSLPLIAWLFSPYAFITFTLLIWLWVVFVLDTRTSIHESYHHPHR